MHASDFTYCAFIQTRYLPATNHRDARIVARNVNTGASRTVAWDSARDVSENHYRAAWLLAQGLDGERMAFGSATPEGFAFAFPLQSAAKGAQ